MIKKRVGKQSYSRVRNLEAICELAHAEASRTGSLQTVVATYSGYRIGPVCGRNLVATVTAGGECFIY
jgi:hypothetical protein